MRQTRTEEEINSIITGTFGTTLGLRCLDYLRETMIDRAMYKKGMTLDEVAFRQGQSDVVQQLLNQMKDK